MAFDINSQYAETESSMQVIEEQSNFFNNLSVIGGKRYLIVREKIMSLMPFKIIV